MSTSDHELIWTYERDSVCVKAVCNLPDDAPCHEQPTCDCDPEGISFGDDGNEVVEVHPHGPSSFCNYVEWLNQEPFELPEMNAERETFEIGRTAIKPVWQGDYYEWARA